MDKLHRTRRDFLLRLIPHGLPGAARMLRTLADELEDLAQLDLNPPFFHSRWRALPDRYHSPVHPEGPRIPRVRAECLAQFRGLRLD